MKRLMLKTLAAAVAISAFGVAFAQEKTIKFTTQNPKGHPLVMGMEKFAEIVQAKSGGKIKVNLFPGGVLGGDAPVVSALQGGTIEMASMNSGILASQVKDFEVYDFPFMFASSKEADAVVDGPFGKKMHAKLEPKGLVGLTYWELGFRQITNSKRAINKVEDAEGLKLRVIPNAINVDWVKALGANPTPLAFPEVYAALEQKAIDGQENPLIGDRREQVLRGAEVRHADQPPVQPAVGADQQEVLGHAVGRREEDHLGRRGGVDRLPAPAGPRPGRHRAGRP
jgi:tripartite ATP-independent transporter DctP family solute receptor